MTLHSIKNTENASGELSLLLQKLHGQGPKDPKILETISFYKEFHPEAFADIEEKILSALGLFYKIDKPDNLYSFLMSQFGIQHQKKYGAVLTPVQASIRRAVGSYQYTSISAPTSAGKSYSIRDFIAESTGDAVVVVPSRALIAEYIKTMRDKFGDNKNVMISSFVDLIYTKRDLRRIFILTPERSKDLYKIKDKLNIQIFFFDEAQTSEETQRGIVFDVTVRRVKKHFPSAKIIFAHPFVENPQAQFSKHNISAEKSYAQTYSHGSVGRICIFQHKNGCAYYFSPYIEGGHHIKNSLEFPESFKDFALRDGKSILVYVSKSSIYKGGFVDEFSEYIQKLENVSDKKAVEIINKIEHIWGANKANHKSAMIELLRKGVVIHHGSVPLEVRFLIEDFIRSGHASLCFATSTLAQGINMPFDIVWLVNNRHLGKTEDERALNFKNLIGRSGRLSKEEKFDYGYVYTSAPISFSNKLNTTFELNENSILDNSDLQDTDTKELVDAIKNDTFDDDKNLPLSKVERLSQDIVLASAKMFIDIIYGLDDIKDSIGGAENKNIREQAKTHLKTIYETSLGRYFEQGESAVFDAAIMIFFLMAQGRSFREIAGIRYNMITNRDNLNKGSVEFLQPAQKLPDKSLKKAFPLYPKNTSINKVSYDLIVFDTYDYMDQIISFCLSDTFIAAFKIYEEKTGDERAEQVIELFRYGTNNSRHILLMRYGFPSEMVHEVSDYVESVDEIEIVFKNSVHSAPLPIREITEWYLPSISK
jgi:helicase